MLVPVEVPTQNNHRHHRGQESIARDDGLVLQDRYVPSRHRSWAPSREHRGGFVGEFTVTGTWFRRSKCAPLCNCTCHHETWLRSPQFLSSILGSLLLSYGGLSLQKKSCSEQSCQGSAHASASFAYYFPQWLLARMIYVFLSLTPLAGPSAALRVHRIVPGDAEVFIHAKTGNVERIRELFQKQLASPHDIHAESGVSPLHVSDSQCV